MSRLDYLFVSNHLSDTISQVKICQGPHSDHALIFLHMGLPQQHQKPGLWCFYTSLLADRVFVTQMSEFLSAWEPPPELTNPTVIWEWLKFKIKGRIIAYQGQKKATTGLMIKSLRLQLQDLTEKLTRDPSLSESNVSQIQSISRELRELEEEKANKAMFRSKCKWA